MIDWGRLTRDRRVLAGGIGALVIIVAGMGAWLLAGSGTSEPSPTPTVTATPTASPSPTQRPTRRPTPSPSPSPTATPMPEGLEDGRLNVLVLGSDSSTQRRARGANWLTDAITVLSIAEDGSHVALISLPRDTVDLRLPDGGIWSGKINSLVPLRGAPLMRDTMGLLLGIPMDHYLMIDMDDFARLVDAVGGVTVSVPYTLTDKRCTIGPGVHHMGGALALCYARHRYSDSDYARAGRHQQLLVALRDQILATQVDVPALVGALRTLQTDIPAGDLAAYADLMERSADAKVDTLLLIPPNYTTFVGMAGARGWISVPNVPAIQAAVDALVSD